MNTAWEMERGWGEKTEQWPGSVFRGRVHHGAATWNASFYTMDIFL